MISNQDMPKKLLKEDWKLMPIIYIGHLKIGQKGPNGDQKKSGKNIFHHQEKEHFLEEQLPKWFQISLDWFWDFLYFTIMKLPKEDWEFMPMLYIGHLKIGQKDPNGDHVIQKKKLEEKNIF